MQTVMVPMLIKEPCLQCLLYECYYHIKPACCVPDLPDLVYTLLNYSNKGQPVQLLSQVLTFATDIVDNFVYNILQDFSLVIARPPKDAFARIVHCQNFMTTGYRLTIFKICLKTFYTIMVEATKPVNSYENCVDNHHLRTEMRYRQSSGQM